MLLNCGTCIFSLCLSLLNSSLSNHTDKTKLWGEKRNANNYQEQEVYILLGLKLIIPYLVSVTATFLGFSFRFPQNIENREENIVLTTMAPFLI